jgi:hypothetical protein
MNNLSLNNDCINSCCYYVCIETYNKHSECAANTVQINFENINFNIINDQEYTLIIEGNCINPNENIISITDSKNNCYGCSIEQVSNNSVCTNNLVNIITDHTKFKTKNISNINPHIIIGNNTNYSFQKSIINIPDIKPKCCIITPQPTPTITPTTTPTKII